MTDVVDWIIGATVLISLAVACFVGLRMGLHALAGGWAERKTHACGWFDWTALGHPSEGKPCPGCGVVDQEWSLRIGRPKLLFGWDWKPS